MIYMKIKMGARLDRSSSQVYPCPSVFKFLVLKIFTPKPVLIHKTIHCGSYSCVSIRDLLGLALVTLTKIGIRFKYSDSKLLAFNTKSVKSIVSELLVMYVTYIPNLHAKGALRRRTAPCGIALKPSC